MALATVTTSVNASTVGVEPQTVRNAHAPWVLHGLRERLQLQLASRMEKKWNAPMLGTAMLCAGNANASWDSLGLRATGDRAP
jgi:hypothetical protein